MTLHWWPAAPEFAPEGDPRVAVVAAVELLEHHERAVILDHQDAYASCSCGWFSTAFLTRDEAERAPCEVERLLENSHVRELRLYARQQRRAA
jgi:hypothetical protein